MSCRCRADTLRLFVRSIAQVDVPPPNRFSTASIRRCRPTTTARGQLPRRAYSTATSAKSQDSLDKAADTGSSSESKRWNEEPSQSAYDTEAIVDFSPDAIDAIASEIGKPVMQYETPSTSPRQYETPLKDLLKDIPVKKPKPFKAPEPTLRRTKVENKGFALHFSAPRRTNPEFKEDIALSKALGRDERRSAPRAAFREERSSKSTREEWTPPAREAWQIEKESREEKYPDGWNPQKKLSPDAIAGIRALHAQMPERYTTWALSQEFGVTGEAIRRILKSKWTPNSEEETDRQRRWLERGKKVWSRWAELGAKPPKPWRQMGIGQGKPDWMIKKQEWAKRQHEEPVLPALITTARAREAKAAKEAAEVASRPSSLEDRIL